MSHTIEEIFAEAVELQESDRAALAGMLLHSLEPSPDARMDDAWIEEIKRRIKALESGEVTIGSVGGSARTLVGSLRLASLASDYFRPPRKMRNELTTGTPLGASIAAERFLEELDARRCGRGSFSGAVSQVRGCDEAIRVSVLSLQFDL